MTTSIRKKRIVGLIGAIGAGKSTVAARLRDLGACVIDADRTGHEVLDETDVRDRLVSTFGPSILGTGNTIDRGNLARIVFADPTARRTLESIVHPVMLDHFREAISNALASDAVPLIVLDAAILLEVGWDSVCDVVAYVDAPRDVRLERLRAGRSWNDAELDRREQAQWPIERKQARANVIIANKGTVEQCREQVDRLYHEWTSGRDVSHAPDRVEATNATG